MRYLMLLALLAACTDPPTRIEGTGEQVMPPPGWVDYCERHPGDPGCTL